MRKTYHKQKGFTLIELLVVVLIIGILVAVALPQYQKAVYKSRYAALKPLVYTLIEAEKIHLLEFGQYTTNFADLAIECHDTNEGRKPTNCYLPNDQFCMLFINSGDKPGVFCENTSINMRYQVMLPSSSQDESQRCVVTGDFANTNTLQTIICKAETGKTKADTFAKDKYATYAY